MKITNFATHPTLSAPATAPSVMPRCVQRSLAQPVVWNGVALHSGNDTCMTITAAPANNGITFSRTDLATPVRIPARHEHVSDARLCTTISAITGETISTIEHIMAALIGVGIDNAHIAVNGKEIPILDGSSEDFVQGLLAAGFVDQETPRQFLAIRKPVEFIMPTANGVSVAQFLPHTTEDTYSFDIELEIDFKRTIIGHQRISYQFHETSFVNEIAAARTFVLSKDMQDIRDRELGKGGNIDNVLVVDDEGLIEGQSLRFQNEFVRHKTLDLIGDLALAGHPIIGRYVGACPGHYINNQLLRALFADADNYELITL